MKYFLTKPVLFFIATIMFFPTLFSHGAELPFCFSDNNNGTQSCGYTDEAACNKAREEYIDDLEKNRVADYEKNIDTSVKINNISGCRRAVINSNQTAGSDLEKIRATTNGGYGDQELDPAKATKEGTSFSLVWECPSGKIGRDGCKLSDVISQVQKLINYGFFMVLIFLPVLFTYAGFIYVSASWKGDKNLGKAKEIFKNTTIAYIVAAAAWAIVHFILKALVVESSFVDQVNKFIQ